MTGIGIAKLENVSFGAVSIPIFEYTYTDEKHKFVFKYDVSYEYAEPCELIIGDEKITHAGGCFDDFIEVLSRVVGDTLAKSIIEGVTEKFNAPEIQKELDEFVAIAYDGDKWLLDEDGNFKDESEDEDE